MSFTINDAYLPATLTAQPMTDEEFTEFCAEHPDLNFEMTAEGEIIVMAPTHFYTGASNSEIGAQLHDWARKDGRGVDCDSSTGFVLPNGARRSPDASWTLKSRIDNMAPRRERKSFLHLCPDFVIELRSDTDRLRPLQKKMREYLENGAQLGWLIDTENRSVEIYRPGGLVETHTAIDSIAADGPVAGFVLNLTSVWDPLAD
jgi:Uma2 family endonuclease